MRLLVFFCAATLAAQLSPFRNLSTTDDGFALYFLSELRQKGSGQNSTAKIFRVTPAGVELMEERAPDSGVFGSGPRYQLTEPQISGDGQLLAFTASRDCFGRFDCVAPDRAEGVLRRADGTQTAVQGRVAISHNGKYAAYYGGPPLLWELETVTRVLLPTAESIVRLLPLDDGRVLYVTQYNGISLWSAAGMRKLPLDKAPTDAISDPAGRTLVYTTLQDGFTVWAHDIASGREARLGTYKAEQQGAVSVTIDGSTVGFVQDAGQVRQFFIAAPDGSRKRQLTSVPDGIATGVLSGYGNVVYAVSGEGRLLRVEVASGAVTEIAPPTPYIRDGFYAGSGNRAGFIPNVLAAPGTLIQLEGTALTVDGALRRMYLGDTEVPRFAGQRYQVPWETAPGTYPVRFESDSPFEQIASVAVREHNPNFLFGTDPADALFHADTYARVTQQNGALPGEVIMGYMTGLGPTSPQVESGRPTPNVLARVAEGFECRRDSPNLGRMEVLYAGLAPGLIGIYQVNIRVPQTATDIPFVRVICGWPDGRGWGYALLHLSRTVR